MDHLYSENIAMRCCKVHRLRKQKIVVVQNSVKNNKETGVINRLTGMVKKVQI